MQPVATWWTRVKQASPTHVLTGVVATILLVSLLALWVADPGPGADKTTFAVDDPLDRVTAQAVPWRTSWENYEINVASTGTLRAALDMPANAASVPVTGPIHPTGLLAQGAFVSVCSDGGPAHARLVVTELATGTALVDQELEVSQCQ